MLTVRLLLKKFMFKCKSSSYIINLLSWFLANPKTKFHTRIFFVHQRLRFHMFSGDDEYNWNMCVCSMHWFLLFFHEAIRPTLKNCSFPIIRIAKNKVTQVVGKAFFYLIQSKSLFISNITFTIIAA